MTFIVLSTQSDWQCIDTVRRTYILITGMERLIVLGLNLEELLVFYILKVLKFNFVLYTSAQEHNPICLLFSRQKIFRHTSYYASVPLSMEIILAILGVLQMN